MSTKLGFAVLVLSLSSGVCVAAPAAAISGVVRDARGIAQMGATVQVFAAGSATVATALTDLYGRYRIANLLPGRYQIRASAPLFVPAMRSNLRLVTGTRATVNLTLAMLSEPASWIPAERRQPEEPADDWTWTLRSAANRPVLRLLDDGQVVLVSPVAHSPAESSRAALIRAQAAMMGGDGGFGEAGLQTVVALDRALATGSDVVVRAAMAPAGTSFGDGPAVSLDAGYEGRADIAGASRLVVSYATHPELISAGGVAGLQMTRLSGARKMSLGDALDLEAGGTVYAVHMGGFALASQPFFRVTVHPGEVWAVRYRVTASRDVQSYDGLNSIHSELPAAATENGRLRLAGGLHQEIALTRKLGGGSIEAAFYHDTIDRSTLSGVGQVGTADLMPAGSQSAVVADEASGSFRFLGMGYTATGVSLLVAQPITADLWARLGYQNGDALSTSEGGAVSLPQLLAGMHATSSEAATAELQGRLPRSATRIRAVYRWQPRHLLTPVASYDSGSDQGFLSCSLRQSLRWGNWLPPGLEARVDVTNLLAQGYRPFLSADGRTLFLAQSPRTLQAGLAFSF